MVSKNWIQNYLAKRWQKLFKNFQAICQSPDPEAVHDLRVEAKKLKAIAILLNQTKEVPEGLSIQLMKPLIQQTGNIREAELHLKMLYEYELDNQELQLEQEFIIRNGYALIKADRKQYKEGIRSVRRQFNQSVRALKDKEIQDYFTLVIEQLIWHFLWPIDKEGLHEGRMKIKDLIYTMGLLPKNLHNKIHLNLKYLDHIQELIGQWHDFNLILCLLLSKNMNESPAFKRIKEKEAGLLEQIQTELQYFDRKVVIS